MIGPENSQHPLNQLNEKNHRNLVTCVFPRFKQFACFRFEFSLVNDDVNLCSDWSLGILWFQFFDTQLKTALVAKMLWVNFIAAFFHLCFKPMS